MHTQMSWIWWQNVWWTKYLLCDYAVPSPRQNERRTITKGEGGCEAFGNTGNVNLLTFIYLIYDILITEINSHISYSKNITACDIPNNPRPCCGCAVLHSTSLVNIPEPLLPKMSLQPLPQLQLYSCWTSLPKGNMQHTNSTNFSKFLTNTKWVSSNF